MKTTIILNATLNPDNSSKFQSMLRAFPGVDHLDLVLLTIEGDVNSAFSLASYLRQRFSSLRVIMPAINYGPGNLIAMVADEWVFGECGAIGLMTDVGGDTAETQEIIRRYEVELASITPHLHPDTAKKLIMLDPDGDCILDEQSANEVSVKIGNLTSADEEMLARYSDVTRFPLMYDMFISIADDKGRNAQFTNSGQYPIVRVRDVERHYGRAIA